MANAIYNSFKYDCSTGAIDLNTDTFKIMLVTSTYTPNIDTHTKRSDITNEVVGSGYSAGGATLSGVAVTNDTTNDRTSFDATDPTWASSSITARGAVIYKSRGGASSADELVCYLDFGADITSTAATFTVTFGANGILLLT
jgi:hypothetical protein